MSREPDECLRLDESLGNAQCNCQPISGTGAAPEFINYDKTILPNVPKQTLVECVASVLIREYLNMNAVSLISDANVETFASMQSSIETLANNWSTIGNDAYCAGTKLPIWAITVIRAMERMYVLFPLMLHPVIIWNRCCLSAYTSLGINFSECA